MLYVIQISPYRLAIKSYFTGSKITKTKKPKRKGKGRKRKKAGGGCS